MSATAEESDANDGTDFLGRQVSACRGLTAQAIPPVQRFKAQVWHQNAGYLKNKHGDTVKQWELILACHGGTQSQDGQGKNKHQKGDFCCHEDGVALTTRPIGSHRIEVGLQGWNVHIFCCMYQDDGSLNDRCPQRSRHGSKSPYRTGENAFLWVDGQFWLLESARETRRMVISTTESLENKMKITSLRPISLSLLVASLVGCATTGPGQNVFMGTGNSFRMNGLLVSELEANSLGVGVSRLTIKSRADADAADKLVRFYADKAAKAAATGAASDFAVSWHLAKNIAQSRIEQTLATEMFMSDLGSRKDGIASLPGGARVFLPKTLYDAAAPEGRKRVSLEDLMFGEVGVAMAEVPNWVGTIKVAALGNALGSLLNQVSTTEPDQQSNKGVLGAMKVGTAYSARDSLGNKYIVEKTENGIVLHNPGRAPTKVDLAQLNYMPQIDRPEQYRYQAAKIVEKINSEIQAAFTHDLKRSAAVGFGGYFSLPPNGFQLGDQVGYMSADGSYSAGEQPAVRKLYSTDRAFKTAVDLTSKENLYNDGIFLNFRSNCGAFALRVRHGDALEYATYSCRDAKNNVTYSRTYVLGNGFSAQNWDSMLKDRSYVVKMKASANAAKFAEAVAAFIPFYGNFEGLARCAGLPSPSAFVTAAVMDSRIDKDVRRMVSYTPEKETPSTVGAALDCAQGVASVANMRKLVSAGDRALSLNKIFSSPDYIETTKLLGLLDTKMHTKAQLSEVAAITDKFASPSAAFVGKLFYDNLQHSNDLVGLASAIYDLAK